ncbi:MAG: transcriptional regulator NrdR [Fusobacteria bacterium]|nr:transcriptional regulator NrdR [Fusobacteriota bacterium]
MKCPFCKSGDVKVVDSRASDDDFAIKRRRECLVCKHRFTTFERFESENVLVMKKNGTVEPFNSVKVRNGIIRALEKRPISPEDINASVQSVEKRILLSEKIVVDSKIIGEYILDELKAKDLVAYIRFASVYNDFNSTDEFINIIESVRNGSDV